MLQESQRMLAYRSATPAVPQLPLRVRSVGRYQLARDWSDASRQKWFVELFWGISGQGEFEVDGEWRTLEPGNVFFYWPGDVHHVRVIGEAWSYCWVTFDHEDAVRWLQGFGLGERMRMAGACPERLFLEIAEALRRGDAPGEIHAANLAHQILAEAASPTRSTGPDSLASRAKSLIDAQFADPQFGVAALSTALLVHRSTLFRQFAAAHGLSPSAYLQNLRLQRGVVLLRETPAPIQEVALDAGFSDPNYFARAIRDATGLSPRDLRKS